MEIGFTCRAGANGIRPFAWAPNLLAGVEALKGRCHPDAVRESGMRRLSEASPLPVSGDPDRGTLIDRIG